MTGYVSAYGPCISCGHPFWFDPERVPSIRVRGEREPVCRHCIERANPERIKKGLPPIIIQPGAYLDEDLPDWDGGD